MKIQESRFKNTITWRIIFFYLYQPCLVFLHICVLAIRRMELESITVWVWILEKKYFYKTHETKKFSKIINLKKSVLSWDTIKWIIFARIIRMWIYQQQKTLMRCLNFVKISLISAWYWKNKNFPFWELKNTFFVWDKGKTKFEESVTDHHIHYFNLVLGFCPYLSVPSFGMMKIWWFCLSLVSNKKRVFLVLRSEGNFYLKNLHFYHIRQWSKVFH